MNKYYIYYTNNETDNDSKNNEVCIRKSIIFK